MTIPCIAIVNKILCHRYRSCEFWRVIKQYAIRKNDLSKKEKMLQRNRQTLRKKTPRKNDTSFSFRGQSRVHARQCISRAANQYSFLTYTAWVETLYTGIGRTAILFFPCTLIMKKMDLFIADYLSFRFRIFDKMSDIRNHSSLITQLKWN